MRVTEFMQVKRGEASLRIDRKVLVVRHRTGLGRGTDFRGGIVGSLQFSVKSRCATEATAVARASHGTEFFGGIRRSCVLNVTAGFRIGHFDKGCDVAWIHRLLDPAAVGVLLLGIVVWRLRPRGEPAARRGFWALLGVWAAAWALAAPVSLLATLGPLEREFPRDEQRPADLEAVIVLGGGLWSGPYQSLEARLTDATMRRCVRAAEIYHAGPPLPILVCGGRPRPDEVDVSEASVMKTFLIRLGVPEQDLFLDEESRNTRENVMAADRFLSERGFTRAGLVTDAGHLPRAVFSLRQLGRAPIPIGCGYRVAGRGWTARDLLPQSEAIHDQARACHEWIGLMVAKLRDRPTHTSPADTDRPL